MMDVLKWVPLLILVVLILILLIGNIVIVQQSKAYVVERLGAFRTVWGVGLHLKVPFVERVAKKVSLKEQVADFAPQPVITKDNVTMQIDTVIYFQITDPKLYTYGVEGAQPLHHIGLGLLHNVDIADDEQQYQDHQDRQRNSSDIDISKHTLFLPVQ